MWFAFWVIVSFIWCALPGAGNRKNLVHSTLLLWYLQSLNCLNLTLIICLHGLEGILDIVEVTDVNSSLASTIWTRSFRSYKSAWLNGAIKFQLSLNLLLQVQLSTPCKIVGFLIYKRQLWYSRKHIIRFHSLRQLKQLHLEHLPGKIE